MRLREGYIAVCLIGIFSYPFLYQPWHMVHHHAHDHSSCVCDSNHCHKEEKAEFTLSSPHQAQCSICDFKFPLNVLPTLSEAEFNSHIFKELQFIEVVSPDLFWGYSRVNPRAPPFIS